MDTIEDEYIREKVKKGDEGSAILAEEFSKTLKNNEFTETVESGMSGISVIRIPDDYLCAVHTDSGDPYILNPVEHAASLIDRLADSSTGNGMIPVAIGDEFVLHEANNCLLKKMAIAMSSRAKDRNVSIPNGEYAIHGADRILTKANVTGTMISIFPKKSWLTSIINNGEINVGGATFSVFDPNGEAVYINNDGNGTKPELNERTGMHDLAVIDGAAMVADDDGKKMGRGKVLTMLIEYARKIDRDGMTNTAEQLSERLGFQFLLRFKEVPHRIRGYSDDSPALNVSCALVSTIAEEYLIRPPHPSAGDYLIAVQSFNSNSRCNGYTDNRKGAIALFGSDYHRRPYARFLIDYLVEPSHIFYNMFMDMQYKGIASSVTHMSGGSFNGKLARWLAKYNLFVEMGVEGYDQLFFPDERQLMIMNATKTKVRDAYGKWPMSNEAFITSRFPVIARNDVESYDCNARVVGVLQEATQESGTGVKFNMLGEEIRFTGTD